MNVKNIFLFILPAFILITFFLALNKNNEYNTQNLIGNQLSDFELKTLDNEKIIRSSDLKINKFTLINFWASWCAPCRTEHNYLILLKKQKQLKILGINFKDKKIQALNFLEELGNPYYYLAKDKNGKASIEFGVYGIPESILIDRNLNIIMKFIGPLNEEDYKKIIQYINNNE
tara:strand:+ start:1214 stop:1735 length:522 start_codon:yes stop_codon:yes gene_type:complete